MTNTTANDSPNILIDGTPRPFFELGTPVGDGWTYVRDRGAHIDAIDLTRGTYQQAVILGHESISGSTLTGTARRFAGQYKRSIEALFARMEKAGIPFEVCHVRGELPSGNRVNRNVLVIG